MIMKISANQSSKDNQSYYIEIKREIHASIIARVQLNPRLHNYSLIIEIIKQWRNKLKYMTIKEKRKLKILGLYLNESIQSSQLVEIKVQ